MVDRLSLAQLVRLADLPQARGAESLPAFLRRVRALGDPEILAVTSSSGALCATGLSRRSAIFPPRQRSIAIASQPLHLTI